MALVGATLIDGTGAPPLSDAVILIEKDRILRVGPRSQVRIPDGADRKDLTGLKILPGLIDSHVHITFALPRGPSDPQADATINGVLQQFLRHGVTSIREVGARAREFLRRVRCSRLSAAILPERCFAATMGLLQAGRARSYRRSKAAK